MKCVHLIILFAVMFLLNACAIFYGTQPVPDQAVLSPKSLATPIGKKWQVIEEAPQLSDERGHVPFQTEQSVQPEGAKPAVPSGNRTIEMPR